MNRRKFFTTGTAALAMMPAKSKGLPGPLSEELLLTLKKLDTPTVSNAVETFNLRPRNKGFMRPEVRCMFPDLGAMVGYAVTAKIRTDREPPAGSAQRRFESWGYILSVPGPRVVVIEDLDDRPSVGGFWGEVNAHIHKALGCVGAVTNGGARDLTAMRQMGFHVFAQHVIVSHAYVHLVEFGTPVTIGGLTVRSGDLIHGDEHGVLQVPIEIAKDIPAAVDQMMARERRIISLCNSPDFSVDKLKAVVDRRPSTIE